MLDALSTLNNRNILVVATGCIGAMFLPTWVSWMQTVVPQVNIRVLLTHSARRFVTDDAISPFLKSEILSDTWNDPSHPHIHIDLLDWPDGYLVHPASIHFLSRISLGLCDSPLMLTLQGTQKPIVVGVSAPPGFVNGPMWQRYLDLLAERNNISVLSPMVGSSALLENTPGSPPVLFSDSLASLAELMQ